METTIKISDRVSAVRAVLNAFRYGSASGQFEDGCDGKLSVTFGKGAFTDGKTVNMPSSLISEEDWDRTLTLGILTHELGHCAFSPLCGRYTVAAEAREKALYRLKGIADSLGVPEKVAEGTFRFMDNVWEDIRVNNLSRFGFKNGLPMTVYSDNELSRRALKKAGSEAAFTAAALKAPLVRNVGLYILSRFDLAMYGDTYPAMLNSVSMEKRLLAGVLMRQMTCREYTSLGLCSLIRKMMECCRSVCGAYYSAESAETSVSLAEELTERLLFVLARRKEKSQANASDSESSGDPEDQDGTDGTGGSSDDTSSDTCQNGAQSDCDDDGSEPADENQPGKTSGSSSDAQSASGNGGTDSGCGSDSAAAGASQDYSAGSGIYRTRIDEFLEEEAEKSASQGEEISVTSNPSAYKADGSSVLKVSARTAVLRNTENADSDLTGEKADEPDAKAIGKFLQNCAECVAALEKEDCGCSARLAKADWWQNLMASCFSGSMTARLRQALQTTMLKTYNRKAKSGFRLARTRIAKVAQGMPVSRPFARKGENEALDTHVVLMCDVSGSMSIPLAQNGLCRTLAILASAFSRVKTDRIKLSVYSFDNWTKKLKGPDENFSAEVLSRLPAMTGGTDGWKALRYAVTELSRSRCNRKVIICLTDGEWGTWGSFNTALLRKAGIETYGIGYGIEEERLTDYSGRYNFPQLDTWLSVSNLGDLPKLMTELFTELIRQSKEKA